MSRVRDFLNRPLGAPRYSGWRWHLAVLRKWWMWYAFWLVVLFFCVWLMASR